MAIIFPKTLIPDHLYEGTVRLNLGNSRSQISSHDLSKQVKEHIARRVSFYPAGYYHSPKYREKKIDPKTGIEKRAWEGFIPLFQSWKSVFPTGVLHEVIAALAEMGFYADIDDTRHVPVPIPAEEWPYQWAGDHNLRAYQQEAIQSILTAGGRGVLQVPTGGGKTVILAGLIFRTGVRKTLILVPTIDLLYQTQEALQHCLGVEVGVIGDQNRKICPITVSTYQTAVKCLGLSFESFFDNEAWLEDIDIDRATAADVKDFIEQCEMVVFDECQHASSRTAKQILEATGSAYYRVGLSATPWRDDGADLCIYGHIGHIVYDISLTSLIDLEFLVPPVLYCYQNPAQSSATAYQTVYRDNVTDNDYTNNIAVESVRQYVSQGLPTMVLVQRENHGSLLRDMLTDAGIQTEYLTGKVSGGKRREVLGDMRSGNLRCLVATTLADEGLDIPILGGLVLAGRGKSSTRSFQRVGRTLRPGKIPGHGKKRYSLVTEFGDEAKHVEKHWRDRRRMWLGQPRFQVQEIPFMQPLESTRLFREAQAALQSGA